MILVKFLTKCRERHIVKVHSTINKSSHMKWWNTSNGSNPTLNLAVDGLRIIIHKCWTSVLRGLSGPPDKVVGMGRLHFGTAEVY